MLLTEATEIVEFYGESCAGLGNSKPPRWVNNRWQVPPGYLMCQRRWEKAKARSARSGSEADARDEAEKRAVYQNAKRNHDRWVARDEQWRTRCRVLGERMRSRYGLGWGARFHAARRLLASAVTENALADRDGQRVDAREGNSGTLP